MSNSIFIGIDPAHRLRGLGVAEIQLVNGSKLLNRPRVNDYGALTDYLKHCAELHTYVFVCVEDSNLIKAIFTRQTGGDRRALWIAQSVGKNKAASALIVQLCVSIFGRQNVKSVSPKDKGAKITAEYFTPWLKANALVYSSTGAGSQDFRDATKLALIAYKSFANTILVK